MEWDFILSILSIFVSVEFLVLPLTIIISVVQIKMERKKEKKQELAEEALKAHIEQENKGLDEDLIKYFNYIADAIDNADTADAKVSKPTCKKNKKKKLVQFDDGVCIDFDMLKYYNYKVNGGEIK